MGFFVFYQNNFKKSTNIGKYIRTTKILRKLVISTQLNSLAFNRSQWIRYFMPRWDKKAVCHFYFIRTTAQQFIDYENDNKDRQKPKIQ